MVHLPLCFVTGCWDRGWNRSEHLACWSERRRRVRGGGGGQWHLRVDRWWRFHRDGSNHTSWYRSNSQGIVSIQFGFPFSNAIMYIHILTRVICLGFWKAGKDFASEGVQEAIVVPATKGHCHGSRITFCCCFVSLFLFTFHDMLNVVLVLLVTCLNLLIFSWCAGSAWFDRRFAEYTVYLCQGDWLWKHT